MTGLFQNMLESPNLDNIIVTVFGLCIKVLLCIYALMYLLF